MAIVKWNTPPSGNQGDRRAHVVGHGDGVALVHSAFGDKVQGGAQINTLGPNIEIATKWSTAPYRGDPTDIPTEAPNQWGYRSPKREKRCMANDDTCMAFATKVSDFEFCYPHYRLAQGKLAWSSNEKPEE
jgi:hypothetical protein